MVTGTMKSSPISASLLFPLNRFNPPNSPTLQIHLRKPIVSSKFPGKKTSIRCVGNSNQTLNTCKNCKTQFDPSLNHPRACRFHTAHFGGETKRKFESVYTGGTMNTPDAGQVIQYWHCCGSEDPFDAGCTAAPHCSYDD
ncbi:carboxypeptidase [Tasmannia lanceolata]|uniref:carboxypeptidase n=1 Tax=Tasmannia lanceolata TaxID=3420 RepID=UPI004063FD99